MLKIRRYLFRSINDLPLKYKFILIYALCVLTPIILINLVFLSKISTFVKEREAGNCRNAMERANTELLGLIEGCVTVSHAISTDRQLQLALQRHYHDFETFYDAYDLFLRNRLKRYMAIYNYFSEIRVYSTNDTIPDSGYYLRINETIKNTQWYQAVSQSPEEILLCAYRESSPGIATSSDQYLCIICKFSDASLANQIQNYVKINIDINKVFAIFNREQNYINLCLVDGANRMIYAPNNRFFYRLNLKTADYNPRVFTKQGIVLQKEIGNAKFLNNWKIIGIGDRRVILRALNRSRLFILGLALVSMLVATVLILAIARSLNYRINKLMKHMAKVENQQFEQIEMAECQDEIGSLIKSFNLMTAKIKALINDVYKLNIQKKEFELERMRTELNHLQSQMNPHFLFNTLNAIMVVCVKNNYTEISEVLKYLSKLLRRLLNRKDDLVSVAEELAFAEMYLKIEKFRFGEKIKYQMTIDEVALQCLLPKMSIQPLIENACKHGIQTIKGIGRVRIKVALTEKKLKVTVSDNGSGIEGEKLDEIVAAMAGNRESNGNIGIRNVYRRLRLYYGEDVEFTISSQLNTGTEVNFAIPVKKL
ncbi:MAG: sensor histidine kinase [Bacillota bacterium]